MANIRHVAIVRKDLQMSPGLLAAQVAHISDNFMISLLIRKQSKAITEDQIAWFKDPYLSVLAVNCVEDLDTIASHAQKENLPTLTWKDTIPSPTFPNKWIIAFVGISIGPADFDRIKIVTGSLQLY